MTYSSPDPSDSRWRCILILFFACLLTGFFCCELNQLLYKHQQPFYDSLSYYDKLFKVMNTSREEGFRESMTWACFANNTNCLPFIIAAIVAPFAEPTRLVGVWIQTGLLFLFLSSVFWYLTRTKGLRAELALIGSLLFLCTKCLWVYNGGLSDFRMDLGLYLSFGMTCAWFLTAMRSPLKRHFVLLGIAASVACLFRAIAPVYLVVTLLPLFVVELMPHENRSKKLFGGLLSIVIVVCLTGWFYFLNFEYLRYYYVEWNTDANAKLPLVDSLKHFGLAQRGVGSAGVLFILSLGIATMLLTSRRSTVSRWIARSWHERELDWKLVWIACAPILMLVIRRAGLNAFVAMPAVFGLVLVFVQPMLFQIQNLNDKRLYRFTWILLGLAIVIAFARGWQRHGLKDRNTMAINHHLIDLMIDDSNDRGRRTANFAVAHISDLSTDCLFSTLLFDRVNEKRENYAVTINDVRLSPIPTFMLPAAADWKNTLGATDSEKVRGLVERANTLVDFLIIPDDKTCSVLQESKPYNYINRFLPIIRREFVLDPSWELLESGIQTADDEFIDVYRRRR